MRWPRALSRCRLALRSSCLVLPAMACAPMTVPPIIGPPARTHLQDFPAAYVNRAEEFERIADAAGWDRGEYASRSVCSGSICPKADGAPEVQIDAVRGVQQIGWPWNPAGPRGTVIARVWNRYGAGDNDFAAQPRRARMYLVVLPWRAGDIRRHTAVADLMYVEVWQEGGQLRLRHAANGIYRQCPLHTEPLPPPTARFGVCTPMNESHPRVRIGGAGGLRGPAAVDVFSLLRNGGGQIGCTDTCCEALSSGSSGS
jgi:hypothetical protein